VPKNVSISEALKECAMIFGFVLTSKNDGLMVSGNVAFSPTPPPVVAALVVITLHPLLSQTTLGSIEKAFGS
jgi:predicted ABC-type sugar transport system permease subunit